MRIATVGLCLTLCAATLVSGALAQAVRTPFDHPVPSWAPAQAVRWLAPLPSRINIGRELQPVRAGRRQGEILMIVGGAGIATGLLVGEGLVTIAGAGVGGYGLFQYLQATR